ncbi:hypothetical protein GCM10009824_02010 [Kocuria atrinae]|uniref:Uncharacterized protein n=1 Tax=Kocuria atrinae TaxID=592377 RepID=A0ABN2XD97_9MICC
MSRVQRRLARVHQTQTVDRIGLAPEANDELFNIAGTVLRHARDTDALALRRA